MINSIKSRATSYARFARLRPFDISTPQGVRDERYRRAILSSITMLLSRSLSMINGLFTIYIISPLFGAERFSAWFVVIAFINFLNLLDMGIPTALVNRSVRIFADDHHGARASVSAIVAILVGLSLLILIFALILAYVAPWNVILKTQDTTLISETRYAALASTPFIIFNIFSAGFSNIVLGMQKGFLASILTGLVNLLGFGSVILASRYAPTLTGMLWASQGILVATPLLLLVYFYRQGLIGFSDLWSAVPREFKQLWSLSRSFFALNVISGITANLDVFLASTLLDPTSVAELVIVQRLFLIYIGLTSIIMSPLWASYADAMVNHDHIFIRKTLIRSFYLSCLLIAVFFIPTILLSGEIFFHWSQGTFSPDRIFVILVAISSAIIIINVGFSYYLNGCGVMRPQIIANIIFAGLVLSSKITFSYVFGLTGLILAGIISTVLANFLTYGLLFRQETFRWFHAGGHPSTN